MTAPHLPPASTLAPQQPIAILMACMKSRRTFACVGIDPVEDALDATLRAKHHDPLAAVREFSIGVLHAVAEVVGVVKFQSACYERYGARGVEVLGTSIAQAVKEGLCVILDVKRGDIGVTADHYAAAAKRTGAHFVTLSGFLGPSSVMPFLDAGLGAFVLVRTSNPDSDTLQSLVLADGRTVSEATADMVRAIGASHLRARAEGTLLRNIGAVVGATKSAQTAALRARMPDQLFLVPGFGAQGGTVEDIHAMLRPSRTGIADAGVVVSASRSVIYAKPVDGRWDQGVRDAARALVLELETMEPRGPARGPAHGPARVRGGP